MALFLLIGFVILAAASVVIWRKLGGSLTLLVVAAAVAMTPTFAVYGITTAISKDSDQTYHEYWNGVEVSADQSTKECQRDGSCANTYQCDPYIVTRIETYTDSKGNPKTRTVQETRYHSCPYSTQETDYYITTTLGSYTAAAHQMTGQPFRAGTGIPGGQVTSPPQLWLDAQARVNAGTPGPVTQVNDYKNYILASDDSILKKYSDGIDQMKADGLLPAPASGVYSLYQADKAYYVGSLPDFDRAAYTQDVAYLNAAVGSELHGDLHVVFADADQVGDATNYANTLMAYWQSKELGRDAIAKNTIVVVLGVDKYLTTRTDGILPSGTSYVKWAKAYTGMPVGNEALLQQIEASMKSQPLDGNLIGHPNTVNGTVAHSDGKLEGILFGANAFHRVSMDALDENDEGSGFHYLSDEWQPSDGLLAFIYILSGFICAIAFALAAMCLLYFQVDKFDPLAKIINRKAK